MGIKMPETCWDIVNKQHPQLTINHLYCCILLVFFPHALFITHLSTGSISQTVQQLMVDLLNKNSKKVLKAAAIAYLQAVFRHVPIENHNWIVPYVLSVSYQRSVPLCSRSVHMFISTASSTSPVPHWELNSYFKSSTVSSTANRASQRTLSYYV